jgi:hypothetical protein
VVSYETIIVIGKHNRIFNATRDSSPVTQPHAPCTRASGTCSAGSTASWPPDDSPSSRPFHRPSSLKRTSQEKKKGYLDRCCSQKNDCCVRIQSARAENEPNRMVLRHTPCTPLPLLRHFPVLRYCLLVLLLVVVVVVVNFEKVSKTAPRRTVDLTRRVITGEESPQEDDIMRRPATVKNDTQLWEP